MTSSEKISAILKMNGNDGADLHFRLSMEGFGMILQGHNDGSTYNQVWHMHWNGIDETEDFCTFDRRPDDRWRNEKAVDEVFNYYAHQEYLKFRNQFSTTNDNDKLHSYRR